MQRAYWARFYKHDDGPGFTVDVPDLPGCVTEGGSWEEAMYMAADAMRLWLEDEVESGRVLPEAGSLEAVAKLPVAEDMGAPRLAEVTITLFGEQPLPEALWADLARVSRKEGLPVADLLTQAVREFLGRRFNAQP
jgi:predicted RNase H-like HicB family nuclease